MTLEKILGQCVFASGDVKSKGKVTSKTTSGEFWQSPSNQTIWVGRMKKCKGEKNRGLEQETFSAKILS